MPAQLVSLRSIMQGSSTQSLPRQHSQNISVQSQATDQALDVLEEALIEVEQRSISTQSQPTTQSSVSDSTASIGDQVVSQVVSQVAQQAELSYQTSGAKEQSPISLEAVDEVGSGLVAEAESIPEPELSPEVSAYIQKVTHQRPQVHTVQVHHDDISLDPPVDAAQPQPVVVLPISSQDQVEGSKKSTQFSIRWLVEWSQKMMKVFVGKAVYRDD